MRKLPCLLVFAFTAFGFLAPAHAQLKHTWVASPSFGGDDSHSCDRTAPCATFVTAVIKTAAGGEVTCIDAGDFAAPHISKSITIDCEASRGGTTSIDISGTTSTDVVVLRGVDLHGFRQNFPNASGGVSFTGAGELHIEKSSIVGYKGSGGGVWFAPSGPAKLYITDTVIVDNGANVGTGGVLIQNSSSSIISVTVANTTIKNNFNGILATVLGSGGMFLTVADTVVSGNTTNGITTVTNAGGIVATLDNVKVLHNGAYGISPNGANTSTRLSRSLVVGNNIGLNTATAGQFFSYQDNRIDGNFSNMNGGALTPTGLK